MRRKKYNLFLDDMTAHIENQKEWTITKKLVEVISDYGKVAGYNVNIYKSTAFSYTSNEQVEFSIKNI